MRSTPRRRRRARARDQPIRTSRMEAMAAEHEAWIVALFERLPAHERDALRESLTRLKSALAPVLGTPRIPDV